VFSDVVTEFLCTTKYGCMFADRFYCKYSSVLIMKKGHLQSIPCGYSWNIFQCCHHIFLNVDVLKSLLCQGWH